jgi:lipopolysaccharide export system protein LptC
VNSPLFDDPAVAPAAAAPKAGRKRERRGRRVSVLMLLGLTILLALGSFWALEVMRRSGEQNLPAGERTDPDYYVEKFNFVRMSQAGAVEYKISGNRLTHDPVHDTHEITLPVVHSLSATRPMMTTQSLRAVSNADHSRLQMYDKVVIDRPAQGRSQAFHLSSEYLLVLPDDDVMSTDRFVDIRLGTSRLSGVGMVADNAKRTLSLAGKVNFTYQPPAPAVAP